MRGASGSADEVSFWRNANTVHLNSPAKRTGLRVVSRRLVRCVLHYVLGGGFSALSFLRAVDECCLPHSDGGFERPARGPFVTFRPEDANPKIAQ
jgi:hypothetical protein